MRVGVVDIGSNSMRLLITDGTSESGRWVEVTGLARGLDSSGSLAEDAIGETLVALKGFGRRMDQAAVDRRLAIATSASRDASNREVFFDKAEAALGVRPTLISGIREGRYAFDGAVSGLEVEAPVVVTDIGGGSTEFVTAGSAVSIDIGTVRLGERALPQRPPSSGDIARARSLATSLFEDVDVGRVASHVGVAGTWTSLAAIALDLPAYDRDRVHGTILDTTRLTTVLEDLSHLTLEETRQIPSLDPKRAPVILPGAILALTVMEALSVSETVVSERDTLDGAAMELIGIR